MTWNSIPLAVAGTVLTAAYINSYLRANLQETFPAKATAAGQIAYATGGGSISVLDLGAAGKVLQVNPGATNIAWDYVTSGSIVEAQSTKTANYTATQGDGFLLCNATSGVITITLYTAVGNGGRKIFIKKIDSSGNTVTIDPNGAQTIDGAATLVLSAQWAGGWIVSDNANWQTLATPGGGTPSGSAGGDLGGTYPNPTVAQASAAFALTGDISPAQITANQNNYAPTGHATASVFRLNSDASRDITGLAGGADGRLVVVHNVGAQNIVLKDESGSSTAGNRFALTADLTLTPDSVAILQYDATSSRWRAVSGGGGSGSAHTIYDETTPLTQRTNLRFVGTAIAAADSAGDTVVTVNGPVALANLGQASVALGSGDVTTTSSTFVAATGVTVTLTTAGNRVLGTVTLYLSDSAPANIFFDIRVDAGNYLSSGTGTPLTNGLINTWDPATGSDMEMSFSFWDTPSAGSHTYALYWRTNAGTATIHADGTNDKAYMTVTEISSTGGGFIENVVSKTAAYTATVDDQVIKVDATAGAFSVTLYAASGNSGRRLTIKNVANSANAVTIDGNASETIDGATTYVMATGAGGQWDSITIECDGTNWIIVSAYGL